MGGVPMQGFSMGSMGGGNRRAGGSQSAAQRGMGTAASEEQTAEHPFGLPGRMLKLALQFIPAVRVRLAWAHCTAVHVACKNQCPHDLTGSFERFLIRWPLQPVVAMLTMVTFMYAGAFFLRYFMFFMPGESAN
jgi:hypothetical protein